MTVPQFHPPEYHRHSNAPGRHRYKQHPFLFPSIFDKATRGSAAAAAAAFPALGASLAHAARVFYRNRPRPSPPTRHGFRKHVGNERKKSARKLREFKYNSERHDLLTCLFADGDGRSSVYGWRIMRSGVD